MINHYSGWPQFVSENHLHYGAMRNVYKISVHEPEGTRPYEKFNNGLENNIKIDLKVIVYIYMC